MTKGYNGLQIGSVARKSGVPIDTIRFYEKSRILEKPIRSPGGFRLYSGEAIERLRFIKKAQGLGLNLGEIKRIMTASKKGLEPCCDLVHRVFTEKIRELDSNINEMKKMRGDINSLLTDWIPPRRARKRDFAICPQIERPVKKNRR